MRRSPSRQTGGTDLALAVPICRVLELASPTDVDVFTGPHEHVACGHDIRDRGLARVIPSYPEGDRNVVRGGAVGDGQQAVQTEQQLCAAIVVRWRRRSAGATGGRAGD